MKANHLVPTLAGWQHIGMAAGKVGLQTKLVAADHQQARCGRHGSEDPGNVGINCVPALIAALAICGIFGGISLLVPPFIDTDSGGGFLAWRGTLLGAVNSIVAPDYEDIARDMARFLTFWSPGQYLVPGAISLLGAPLGVAMTLTVALALLASLIGWIMIVRAFAPSTSLAILIVVLIGSFIIPHTRLALTMAERSCCKPPRRGSS